MRLFDEHIIRKTKSLDGAWRFAVDENNIGITDGWQNGLPNYDTVIVPSVWNMTRNLMEYEGAAWYERSFYTEGGTLRFVFGGVMTEARVYLDGKEIGYHYGGFCQFEIIADGVAEGYHTLILRVDNSFDEYSIPQSFVDWYHYGGITRSVSVEELCGISILSNRVEYTVFEKLDKVTARIALELYNASDAELCDTVSAAVGNYEVKLAVTLSPRETREVYTAEIEIADVSLWSGENPSMYSVAISTSTDDLYDRIGFRKIEVKDGKILLNGKEIKLLGVNRHEEHPDFGFAFPASIMERDVDIAVEMGCNALRGAHYPNHPVFLDMLDERGIFFWSEVPIWGGGFDESRLNDSAVIERGADMHREMIKHYYNHPSIIIWGMHNEILTDTDAGVNMSKAYYSLLKETGGNRIVSYATNHALSDISYEYCDVISINQYNGWYAGDISSWNKFVCDLHAYIEKQGHSDKPIIISEFGAAAVYGHRTFEAFRWSERYQAELLSEALRIFLSDEKIVGTFIWQFADIRTSREAGISRARGYNNKGLLNEYRNPKEAYFVVRDIYRAAKNK